jgi:aryl-alcohol dehydrogenase-like predicted oxidoreductase
MEYREHRGQTLSEIGIGCYALSGAYGNREPGYFADIARRAYELGVTLFDTADQYGPAEEILGRAVAQFRDKIWIATKVGVTKDGGFNLSSAHVQASCERSLKRLGTDVIDLYQVHYDDPDTPIEETLDALRTLQKDGKIRHFGVGHLSPPRLEGYLTAGDVFSTLMELSAVSRSGRERTLPLCRTHNVGVIAFSVTGRGLLTGKIKAGHTFGQGDIRRVDALFQRERLASGLRIVERLRALGEKHGKTPAQVAISWVLAQPGVICALTGPSTISHLEENLASSGWSLDAEEMAAFEDFLEDEDTQLREHMIAGVRGILQEELKPQTAFTDLVYCLETVAELRLMAEQDILPLFERLWPLRERRDSAADEKMRDLQSELRQLWAEASGNPGRG